MPNRQPRRDFTNQRLLEVYAQTEGNFTETSRILGVPRTTLRSRIISLIGTQEITKEEVEKQLEFARRFNAKLVASGINPDLVNLDRMVVKEWQQGFKDNEGVGHVQDLSGVTFFASPTFESGPQWPLIQPADPILIQHTQRNVERRAGERVAVVATDPQIGYLLEMGTDPEEIGASLTPFHDEAAIDVAKQIVHEIAPDTMVHGGDTIDFPEHTRKFRRFPEYQRTTQFALQRGHRYFAEFAAAAGPQCAHKVVDGNHDARIANDTLDNQIASFGLRPAAVPGEAPNRAWPSNSLPSLLRFDFFENQGIKIEYGAPYPAGRIWLNDHIMFRHDTSQRVAEQAATVLHGHDHKLHVKWRKIYLRGIEVQIATAGCGSLCRNDLMLFERIRRMPSYVPSAKYEQNWQQGLVVVTFNENGGPDDFDIHPIKIKDGKARYGGKTFESSVTVDGKLRA